MSFSASPLTLSTSPMPPELYHASPKLYHASSRYCRVLDILEQAPTSELPFDPTAEFLVPSEVAGDKVKVPQLKQGDGSGERQLFGSSLYQLFIR